MKTKINDKVRAAINSAALMDKLDTAIRCVQESLGVEFGDYAAQHWSGFAEKNWGLGMCDRAACLLEYAEAELRHMTPHPEDLRASWEFAHVSPIKDGRDYFHHDGDLWGVPRNRDGSTPHFSEAEMPEGWDVQLNEQEMQAITRALALAEYAGKRKASEPIGRELERAALAHISRDSVDHGDPLRPGMIEVGRLALACGWHSRDTGGGCDCLEKTVGVEKQHYAMITTADAQIPDSNHESCTLGFYLVGQDHTDPVCTFICPSVEMAMRMADMFEG